MLQVVWFKRDLRLADHRPLVDALSAGPTVPLYVAEPDYWKLPDTSARQWAFTAECLAELRADITAIGGALIVRTGDVVDILSRLHRQHGITRLVSHEETGNLWTYARDRRVAAFCRSAGIRWTQHRQFGVFRGPLDRDRWAAQHGAFMAEPITPAPVRLLPAIAADQGDIPDSNALGLVPDACPGRQIGGRREALQLLDSFLNGRGRTYHFAMSSPLTAADACSRLSAHLALGTLSMRETFARIYVQRNALSAMPPEQRPLPIRALDALVARLHWHCHFIQKLESEPAIETRAVHPFFERARTATSPDDPRLIAWIEGQTGLPFVDACMRALKATGWINFRMRAMLQAVASYHLNLDFTASGARLAQRFVDYEPGIHWSQTQMQSGLTGINTPRIYNPVKQSLDQDADGVFIRRWVPELAHLEGPLIHEPWRADAGVLAAAGVKLDRDYPAPIVEHMQAARDAKARISEVRRQEGFSGQARAVYQRHGSRKRTLSNDDPARSRAIAATKAKKAARQMMLDL